MDDDGQTGRVRVSDALADRGPLRVARDVLALDFRGSRVDLEFAIALRLQAAVLLIFLAVRCVHLGQAAIDLALARDAYTREALAIGVGAACLAESAAFAAATLGARRLTRPALLADAAFALTGLAVMSLATSGTAGRVGTLNWMLPYSVATATGLGFVARGSLVAWRGEWRAAAWPAAAALVLAATYVLCNYLSPRLPDEHAAQIWGNAANYVVFFVAGALTAAVARRRLDAIHDRNADVARVTAALAHEAQWRAVAVDVFTPVVALLDRVSKLEDGPVPSAVQGESARLCALIDAVRPGAGGEASQP